MCAQTSSVYAYSKRDDNRIIRETGWRGWTSFFIHVAWQPHLTFVFCLSLSGTILLAQLPLIEIISSIIIILKIFIDICQNKWIYDDKYYLIINIVIDFLISNIYITIILKYNLWSCFFIQIEIVVTLIIMIIAFINNRIVYLLIF